MTANLKNTVSPVASAIAQAMNEATKSENRQTATIAAAFNDEGATFTTSRLMAILAKEGTERTEAIDNLLCDISEDFDNLAGKYDLHKEEKKNAKGNKKREEEIAFAMAEINGKMKAAREFITRVLKSVYHLRQIKAVSVVLNKKNRLSVIRPDEENPKVNVKFEYTGRELVAESAATITALKPNAKKTEEKKQKTSVAEGMRSAFEASRKYLESGSENLDNLSDALEDESDKLLLSLLRRKFADDKGTVDWKLVADFYGEKGFGKAAMSAADAEKMTKKTAA